MRLIEIRIEDFGRLQNRVFTPGAGLTLIEGPNESGKSTLLAFLRFAFYGFPKRNGPEAEERDKRLSWSSRRAAGSVILENAAGERFRIARAYTLRGSAGRETPSEMLSVTKLPEGTELPLDGKTPGEYFLGLPAELYRGSLCVGQADAARVTEPGIGEAVGTLLFSGEASFSADGAEKILDNARRELSHVRGKGGRIAELEESKAALAAALTKAQSDAEKLQSARANVRRARAQIEQKRAQLTGLDAALERAETDRVLAQFAEWHNAVAAAAAARDKAENVRVRYAVEKPLDEEGARRLLADLRDVDSANAEIARATPDVEILRGVRPDPAKLAASEAIRTHGGADGMRAFLEKIQKKRTVWMVIAAVFAVLALGTGAGAAFFASWRLPLIGAAAGLTVLALCGVVFACRAKKAYRRWLAALGVKNTAMLRTYLAQCVAEEQQNEARAQNLAAGENTLAALTRDRDRLLRTVREGLAAYGGNDFSTTAEAVAEIKRLAERTREAREAINAAQTEATRLGGAAEALHRPLAGQDENALHARQRELPPVTEDAATLRSTRAALTEEIAALERAAAEAGRTESAQAALAENPAALAAKLAQTETQLHAANARLAAVEMAKQALDEAVAGLRRGLTPKLAQDASRIFAALTNGAYDGIRVDKDFIVSLDAAGTSLPISRFSAGCRDAAYLSLRIALLATLSEEQLPLLLDEALAQLDDTRARAFLDVLRAHCKAGGQCLLFSCHSREREWLADDPAATVITM